MEQHRDGGRTLAASPEHVANASKTFSDAAGAIEQGLQKCASDAALKSMKMAHLIRAKAWEHARIGYVMPLPESLAISFPRRTKCCAGSLHARGTAEDVFNIRVNHHSRRGNVHGTLLENLAPKLC